MQTKKHSVVEITLDLLIGMIIALLAQIFILNQMGIEANLQQNIEIVLFMTAVSFIRRYITRRIFNEITRRQYHGIQT